jgi:hypothetical protein
MPSCFSVYTSGNYLHIGKGKVACLHAMEVYMRSRSIAPLLPNLHTRRRLTGSFTPVKEIRYLLNRALGWAQSLCGHFEESEKFLASVGIHTPNGPARRLVSVRSTLSRIPLACRIMELNVLWGGTLRPIIGSTFFEEV